jgi:hypothetical protein
VTAQRALKRATENVLGVGRWLVRFPVRLRLAARDLREARETRRESRLAQAPSVRERQAELIRFYDGFENLVEVLCAASQYGPDARQEASYEELRSQMQAEYPRIRRFAAAFLSYDARDAARSQDLHGTGRDAFEALYAAPTLAEFLRSDDGEMIWRIERAREALSRYGEHLRQLLSQERP